MTISSNPLTAAQQKLVNNRLGLWLFILSDAFMFGGILVARIYLLGETRPHLEQTTGFIITAILLVSSFFMNRAETSIAFGDRRGFLISTALTLLLGLGFLIGVVGFEWRITPFGPGDGAPGAIFYLMTGMHAFHVLTGVIFLAVILRNGLMGHYSADEHWAVEACANYWHFVDIVWQFFYPALYLVGVAVALP